MTDELDGHDPLCPVGGLLRREGCPDCYAIEQAEKRGRTKAWESCHIEERERWVYEQGQRDAECADRWEHGYLVRLASDRRTTINKLKAKIITTREAAFEGGKRAERERIRKAVARLWITFQSQDDKSPQLVRKGEVLAVIDEKEDE